MPTADTTFSRQLLEACLTSGWMRRCGPTGQPGEWAIPGELVEVVDAEVELTLYPTYAIVDESGRPTMWSGSFPPGPDRREAWLWRIDQGWDSCSDEEVEFLESIGGCFDDRQVDFHTLGSHQERPEVPEQVVDTYVALAYRPAGAT